MGAFLRKYNTLLVAGTTAIRVPIIKRAVVDFAVGADWTPVAGDVKILVDNTAAANVTNLPTAIASGNGAVWEFVLTAAELSAKQVEVTIVDAATKAVEDQSFIVETFGNASAMYPVDFSDVVRMGLTALPNAAAEAAGGLYTRGSGAGQIAQSNNGRVDSDAKTIANAAISSATFSANAIDAAAIATDAIGASELAAGAATKIRDTILSDATTFAGASIALIKAKTDNLPEGIKKNTALNNFEFFMADSTDHVTGKTGLAVTGTTSIDGGVFAALTNAVTEVASGVYKVNLAAADVNGDVITLKFTAAGADATLITFKTSP